MPNTVSTVDWRRAQTALSWFQAGRVALVQADRRHGARAMVRHDAGGLWQFRGNVLALVAVDADFAEVAAVDPPEYFGKLIVLLQGWIGFLLGIGPLSEVVGDNYMGVDIQPRMGGVTGRKILIDWYDAQGFVAQIHLVFCLRFFRGRRRKTPARFLFGFALVVWPRAGQFSIHRRRARARNGLGLGF